MGGEGLGSDCGYLRRGGSGGEARALPSPRLLQVVAIVICGQPSVSVVGVGDVVFGTTTDGRAVAPAGRMSQMTYPADYVNQVCPRWPSKSRDACPR